MNEKLEKILQEAEKLSEQIKEDISGIEKLVIETKKAGENIILTPELCLYILSK